MRRNRTIAVFVGQSYLNYTPDMELTSVLFTSAHEKHFVRKSVRLARTLFTKKYYGEND